MLLKLAGAALLELALETPLDFPRELPREPTACTGPLPCATARNDSKIKMQITTSIDDEAASSVIRKSWMDSSKTFAPASIKADIKTIRQP